MYNIIIERLREFFRDGQTRLAGLLLLPADDDDEIGCSIWRVNASWRLRWNENGMEMVGPYSFLLLLTLSASLQPTIG